MHSDVVESKFPHFEYIYARGDPERLFLNGLYSTHRADRHFKVCIAILKELKSMSASPGNMADIPDAAAAASHLPGRPQHTIICIHYRIA